MERLRVRLIDLELLRLAGGSDVQVEGKRGTQDDSQARGSAPSWVAVVPFTEMEKTRGGRFG